MPKIHLSQEGVVVVLGLALFVGFSVTLNGFLTAGNMSALLKGVSILGILGLGMALVVIGRGIDLSMIATLVTSMSVTLTLANSGYNFAYSLLIGVIFVVAVGLIIGIIVAYAEIPAVFTTLAMSAIVFGIGRAFFFSTDVQNTPSNVEWLQMIGYGTFFGVPYLILAFGATALFLYLLLKYTLFGRYVYAIGDNPLAAKLTGLPVRPVIVAQYVLAALIAYLAALVMAASNSGINTRLFNSTMIYDVLLVVVLGGIGLSGGKGSVRNILVGTVMVGTLQNGMTIMDVSFTLQNLIKSVILLAALIADTFINPRDEQTAQQGDI
ncbi:ABC transporter permease [Paracoccus sp. (in: a-proteobacteria)]|uniref:ABC transporter permease n=1 Tax=Paracoccus sp. TaxID=267 RepID=UPI002AFE5035|nr:ABC transporter permease [Paracoccus sp. (in: a-proteobacteria)]